MEGIYETNDNFPFNKLILLKPVQTGGNYFIKFRINDTPLYIQPPKCKSKGGIMKAGKKLYSDLMFTNENENFIRWMENLENHCQKIIYENREKWFETELDNHDIENSFVSPLKTYKSGKYYITRTNIPCILGKCSLKIYDEYENEIYFENIKDNNDIMCILEVQGIKCSTRSFQIEIEIKQMLLLKPTNMFEKCIIKPLGNTNIAQNKENEQKMDVLNNEQHDNAIINNETIELNIVTEGKKDEESENNLGDLENEETKDLENEETKYLENEETKYLENEETKYLENEETKDLEKEIYEVELNLDEIEPNETIQLKNRKDVYYKMYKEAKRKAKGARDLALSSFLEAKRIKNTYMLDEIDSESDLEEDSFEFGESN